MCLKHKKQQYPNSMVLVPDVVVCFFLFSYHCFFCFSLLFADPVAGLVLFKFVYFRSCF